ncbi:hypothetical protein EVAR_12757_1 [Eumeta japonica]|uniref:Uncharacterized protein n=1 Tax=Eumeta variegata TaxID=151549 RepID=A0A4C1UAW5_EUMVA|nr:hypothetical protein EVAR_12757_1 [Eumeta japonica]
MEQLEMAVLCTPRYAAKFGLNMLSSKICYKLSKQYCENAKPERPHVTEALPRQTFTDRAPRQGLGIDDALAHAVMDA